MSFIKQTLKNTASLVLAAGIIGTAYAAITTVNSGDPLTASSWNEIVTKVTSTDTNSSDLTTKAYVDSSVSASGGAGWSNCESKFTGLVYDPSTLTCSAGKSIRSFSTSCSGGAGRGGGGNQYAGYCGTTSLTLNSIEGIGATNRSYFSASIICCDD